MPIDQNQPPDAAPSAQRVEQRIRTARDSLPGQRDALPPGSLSGVATGPHGDENRDPPPNAPTPPP